MYNKKIYRGLKHQNSTLGIKEDDAFFKEDDRGAMIKSANKTRSNMGRLDYAMAPHPSQAGMVLWTAWLGDGEHHRESLKQGVPTNDGVVLRVASSTAQVNEIMARALASEPAKLHRVVFSRPDFKGFQDCDDGGNLSRKIANKVVDDEHWSKEPQTLLSMHKLMLTNTKMAEHLQHPPDIETRKQRLLQWRIDHLRRNMWTYLAFLYNRSEDPFDSEDLIKQYFGIINDLKRQNNSNKQEKMLKKLLFIGDEKFKEMITSKYNVPSRVFIRSFLKDVYRKFHFGSFYMFDSPDEGDYPDEIDCLRSRLEEVDDEILAMLSSSLQ